jgi:hypothetical protein
MISVSVSEPEPPLGCCWAALSDPEPAPSAVAGVWEDANEAASSVVNIPMKQSPHTDESGFDLLGSVFKRTNLSTHTFAGLHSIGN